MCDKNCTKNPMFKRALRSAKCGGGRKGKAGCYWGETELPFFSISVSFSSYNFWYRLLFLWNLHNKIGGVVPDFRDDPHYCVVLFKQQVLELTPLVSGKSSKISLWKTTSNPLTAAELLRPCSLCMVTRISWLTTYLTRMHLYVLFFSLSNLSLMCHLFLFST